MPAGRLLYKTAALMYSSKSAELNLCLFVIKAKFVLLLLLLNHYGPRKRI